MNINLRQAVKNNLKDSSNQDIFKTINDATSSTEDKVLPGLGVLFEIMWKHSNENTKNELVQTLIANL